MSGGSPPPAEEMEEETSMDDDIFYECGFLMMEEKDGCPCCGPIEREVNEEE